VKYVLLFMILYPYCFFTKLFSQSYYVLYICRSNRM